MSYPTLPDRRMNWDDDGTIYALGSVMEGVLAYPDGTHAIHANGFVYGAAGDGGVATLSLGLTGSDCLAFLFFPEQREVTAFYAWGRGGSSGFGTATKVEGSNDTTNGLDGTWETASLGGAPTFANIYDWRKTIKTISFTGPKRTVRFTFVQAGGVGSLSMQLLHVYGKKTTGATPDDILFLDPTLSDAEFDSPLDFGDQPLGTTVVKTFKVENGSSTLTANTINIQCNDTDFAISDDGVTYGTTISISSLAAGAKSATLYIRCTTPAAGSLMGPRFARILVTVASYS